MLFCSGESMILIGYDVAKAGILVLLELWLIFLAPVPCFYKALKTANESVKH